MTRLLNYIEGLKILNVSPHLKKIEFTLQGLLIDTSTDMITWKNSICEKRFELYSTTEVARGENTLKIPQHKYGILKEILKIWLLRVWGMVSILIVFSQTLGGEYTVLDKMA